MDCAPQVICFAIPRIGEQCQEPGRGSTGYFVRGSNHQHPSPTFDKGRNRLAWWVKDTPNEFQFAWYIDVKTI